MLGVKRLLHPCYNASRQMRTGKTFLLSMAMIMLVGTTLMADVSKGKRYYMKNFRQKFKMSGFEFVQLHTQAEWKALFKDDAKGFIAEFSQKYPKYEAFLRHPKRHKKLQHIGDFTMAYASDSGKIPSCDDDGAAQAPIDLEVQESSSAVFF